MKTFSNKIIIWTCINCIALTPIIFFVLPCSYQHVTKTAFQIFLDNLSKGEFNISLLAVILVFFLPFFILKSKEHKEIESILVLILLVGNIFMSCFFIYFIGFNFFSWFLPFYLLALSIISTASVD